MRAPGAPDAAGPEAVDPAPDLRAVHVAETRRRIVASVNLLLAEEHPSAISVPAVARRSGVSLATIYRHFPNKEALLEATAVSVDQSTRAWLGDRPIAPGRNLGEFLGRMWSELSENLPALRASHLAPMGLEVRRLRSERRHADAVRGLQEAGIDVERQSGQRLVRLSLVLTSSSVCLEQLDRLGLPITQAAEDVTWAIETLTTVVRRHQRRAARSAHEAGGPSERRSAT
jgi:AcrR family transcriptional regulator